MVTILVFFAAAATVRSAVELNSTADSVGYILGRDVGSQLEAIKDQISLETFNAGVEQAMEGQASQIDSAAAQALMEDFSQRMQEKFQEEQAKAAQENKEKSDQFLASNKGKEGVKTTSSGLQYKIIKQGNGPRPGMSDSVVINYKGMLTDNTIIDSTSSGEPASLSMESAIPGLSEGLLLMNQGSQFIFYLPPELAYGTQGFPPTIPPNSVLIFEVELVEVQ
ncbi:MAG: FKBP-type peptidyl-prolyl cis-trans isomerase N-terminal domain-containing protein [Chitinispirillaceae bacterium]